MTKSFVCKRQHAENVQKNIFQVNMNEHDSH